jgi:signal transduction histidine kinase
MRSDHSDPEETRAELEAISHELQETQAQLANCEKMAELGNLTAGIAHEINTPIAAISSMHNSLMHAVDKLTEALETQFPRAFRDSQDAQDALETIANANRVIKTGTAHVVGFVRSLRSIIRDDKPAMVRANLHDGIDQTLLLVSHELKNRIAIERNYGEIPDILCHPNRLNQVFLNLLINASQAIEETGTIVISTCMQGNDVVVSVEDTGMGISQENLGRIFDTGFTTKDRGKGTGLGLAISRQIVEAHGGKIQATSNLDRGTIMTIILPENPSVKKPDA